jgi:hypothetical protein
MQQNPRRISCYEVCKLLLSGFVSMPFCSSIGVLLKSLQQQFKLKYYGLVKLSKQTVLLFYSSTSCSNKYF